MNPLWLALDLPRLPLEAHTGLPGPEAGTDSALPGGEGGRAVAAAARIVACDDAALAAGVAPGMGVAVARAVAPQLAVLPRNTAREAAALETLACWAGGFTPRVSLAPPRALLLEIGGCLRYFGGAERLVAAVAAGAAGQGFGARTAIAPTPRGALWLARAEAAAICLDLPMLAAALDGVPPAVVDLPAGVPERLAGFGAATLGAARRLPRAGLAQRIGAAGIALLAQAYGELPDPRPDFVFPERFAQSLELPTPVENAAALLFAARRLTAALAGWLSARQAGIAECVLHLDHRGRAPTAVVLRFAAATRDAERLERVLRERLERLALAAPAESLRLAADGVLDLPGRSGVLFGSGERGDGMAALVERLRARLGDACVHGIAAAPDHRPEGATRILAEGDAGTAVAAGARPFWLLAMPESLHERDGRPWRKGPLRLLAGPERIESGWWGGAKLGNARRDYFVALTADARWAWIFRELRPPGGWFLHGWFA